MNGAEEVTRPPEVCIACRHAWEARPGARLCRSCVEVAWMVGEAIHAEEREGAVAENGGE